MKTFILWSLTILCSCKQPKIEAKSRQQIAEDSIQAYFIKTLDNPASYEPVEFSNLDSLYNRYFEDTLYKQIIYRYEVCSNIASGAYILSEKHRVYFDSASYYLQKEIDFSNDYKGTVFKGWQVTHTLRATNRFNALIKQSYTIEFDSLMNITQVYNSEGEPQITTL